MLLETYLPGGGEVVGRCINDCVFEDIAGLLRHTLTQILVVNLYSGHVASVTRNDS